jgi:hypothetical protein
MVFFVGVKPCDVNGQDNKSYRTKTSTMSHQLHADTRGNMSYRGIWKRTGAVKLTWYRSRLSYSGRRSSSPSQGQGKHAAPSPGTVRPRLERPLSRLSAGKASPSLVPLLAVVLPISSNERYLTCTL